VAFDGARRDLSAGDYGTAAEGFKEYLRLEPSGTHQDEALFHLALIYVSAGKSLDDCQTPPCWHHAQSYLTKLISEVPASPLRPAAEAILALKNETTALETRSSQRAREIAQLSAELQAKIAESQSLETRIQQLNSDLERASTDSQDRDQRIKELAAQLERVKTESNERDQRIRQLSTQLDRLIRIDSERGR
jgi:TolA-binding protein